MVLLCDLRGLVGYRSVFSSDTRGTGFMHRAFLSMLALARSLVPSSFYVCYYYNYILFRSLTQHLGLSDIYMLC